MVHKTYPVFTVRKHQSSNDDKLLDKWYGILKGFNVPLEYYDQLTEVLLDNSKRDSIVFHLGRFYEKFNEGHSSKDYRMFHSITCILYSLGSPIVPTVEGYGVKSFNEWRVEQSSNEDWSLERIVRECELAYRLVEEKFPTQKKYTKKDVYDMLLDLYSLDRIIWFKHDGSKGVYENMENRSEEDDDLFKGVVEVARERCPNFLKRVWTE